MEDMFQTAAEAARQPLTKMKDRPPEIVMAVALRAAGLAVFGSEEGLAFLKLAAALDPPDAEGKVNLWDPEA